MSSVCSSARNQVTILGINSLFGKVVSFLLKQSPVANRLVLYDEVDTRVAHDIAEIPTPCKVVVYNGEEQLRCAVKSSDVILIGDKDDCLANEDEAISRKAADIIRYANAISSIAPNAIILIAATPVNSLLPLFTEAQIGCGAFDSDKVMGVTSADTMRASTLLARHMGIDPEKAYLPVIGGSSADTRIPLFSQSRPTINANKNDLKNLTRVVKMTEDELKMILNRGEALNKAYATVQLIDSVMSALRGQRNISEIVLSRTCLVPNVDYFSLPVILGPRGIAHRFPLPSLTERETILLDHAVKHIEIDKMKGINALCGECCIPQAPEMTEKYSELINCCQKDLVGSLMEKFKIRADCPEVCEPRVEYKLLSKVKLKLPPESKPSEMPKRTKFIEPDTPSQDGCCPLKLPCPPIPPIRGLNQIQRKHTCKSRDKPKQCKCFFPPVEKSLVPCKLCPSNKPCVDYGDFKAFYEEQRHCCGPISSVSEESPHSDVALISAGIASHNPVATHHSSSVNEPHPPATLDGSDTGALSITAGETITATAQQPKKTFFHAVWEYPRADVPSKPVPNPTTAVAQHAPPAAAQQSTPSMSQESHHKTMNQVELQKSNQLTDPTLQHDDPNWPFKCSTALCLDALAPIPAGCQSPQDKSVVSLDHASKLREAQKQSDLQNTMHVSTNLQNPQNSLPSEHNTNKNDQQQQLKRYNYNSGLNPTNPEEVIKEIITYPIAIEEVRPLMDDKLHHSGHQEDLTHSDTCQQDTSLFPMMPNVEMNSQIESISSNLKGCVEVADLPNQKMSGHELNTVTPGRPGANKVESHPVIRKSSSIPQDIRGPADSEKLDDRHRIDENVKRRIYATLKVIEDIKSGPKPSSPHNDTTGLSLSKHFNDECDDSNDYKRIPKSGEPEHSSVNSMLSILRDRAKTINANMELQRDLRACMDRSKRKRRRSNLGLGDLIDTINPTKRLESRPALRNAYQGLQKMYVEPKRFGNQGKSAGLLVTPKPDHEEKSLVIVENSEESKKLSSRIDRIKERIQEALKKIIYPTVVTPSAIKPGEKISRHQQMLNHNLVMQPKMKKSSKAKQGFFVEMRRMDPAYRTTTPIYAPKCPTRLLYDDHPKNHSKIITFNNVIEKETKSGNSSMENHTEEFLEETVSPQKDTECDKKRFVFPDVPDFPELILRDMELKSMAEAVGRSGDLHSQYNGILRGREPKDETGCRGVHSVNRRHQETRFSGPGRLQGDYVKHFETRTLPKDTHTLLPESVKAAIRERTRNVATPGSMRSRRRNDMRGYGMTSPNRMTYSRKPN